MDVPKTFRLLEGHGGKLYLKNYCGLKTPKMFFGFKFYLLCYTYICYLSYWVVVVSVYSFLIFFAQFVAIILYIIYIVVIK